MKVRIKTSLFHIKPRLIGFSFVSSMFCPDLHCKTTARFSLAAGKIVSLRDNLFSAFTKTVELLSDLAVIFVGCRGKNSKPTDVNQLLTDGAPFQGVSEKGQQICIAQLLCNLAQTANVIIGSGSPEGAQTTNPGRLFWDIAGKHLWVKETGTATNTGWYQIV